MTWTNYKRHKGEAPHKPVASPKPAVPAPPRPEVVRTAFQKAKKKAEEQRAAAAPPPKKEETTWIELQVVWALNSKPVPNVRLLLEEAEKKETMHQTAGAGKVRISGLKPGAYTVRGRALDDLELASTLGFTALGPARGGGAKGKKGKAPPERSGGQDLAVIEAHKVKTGETLAKLAEQAGMTEEALARFNWGTADRKKVPGKLQDEVGCTKRSKDGKSFVFDDTDKPGVVFVPKRWEQKGLATKQTHVLQVEATSRFLVILENAEGLRVPEAKYEAELADGSKHEGTLGVGGVDAIESPPDGPIFITYPDHDDIAAKSAAATAAAAIASRDPLRILDMLEHSPPLMKKIVAAYDKYFNDHAGKGFLEDVYAELTDDDSRLLGEALMLMAGLKPKSGVKQHVLAEEKS